MQKYESVIDRGDIRPLPEVDIDPTGAELRPGRPDICQGNGEHPDFEICCDNCDWFLDCFPEYMKRRQ